MSETFIEPPDGPPPPPAPGPITQSAQIGFRAVYLVTLLLCVLWLASNCRIISSDSQAVVVRFGRIVRTQEAGLLIAWPRPIEQILMLPGPDRQISHQIAALPMVGGIEDASSDAGAQPVSPNAAPYLTGDGNVVMLESTLIFRITDPTAYVLSEPHLVPALDRLFRAVTVGVAAGHGLNDFVVAQPTESDTTGPQVSALRGEVRDQLLAQMNARLKTLAAVGDGLGIEVERIDMTASLPPAAKVAFDDVLTATQKADQDVAAANTAAELRRQGAQREADRLVSTAQASAIEQAAQATTNVASIIAIERAPAQARAGLEQQAYRSGVGQAMAKAGAVIVVDPSKGSRLIMAGGQK